MAVYWNEGIEYAFISYNTEEYRDAVHLKESLSKNGITSWMAPDSIEGGMPKFLLLFFRKLQ